MFTVLTSSSFDALCASQSWKKIPVPLLHFLLHFMTHKSDSGQQQTAAEVFHRWFTAAFRGNDWHPDRHPQRRDERPFLTENTGVTNYIHNGLHSSQVCQCQGPARWPTSLHLNGMEPSLISLVSPVLFLLFQVKHLLWYRLQLRWITTFTTLSHRTNIVVFIVIHSDYKGPN